MDRILKSPAFELALTAARARLTSEMARRRLFPEDGWTISAEEARSARQGHAAVVVLKPRHPSLETPEGLKQVVRGGRL